MSEEKRYFTAVFEWTDAYSKSGNPFMTDTHAWGPALGLATGDLMAQSQIYEDALNEITERGCSQCAEMAQKAIDKADADLREQLAPRVKAVEKVIPREPEQLDIVEAIAAAGGRK